MKRKIWKKLKLRKKSKASLKINKLLYIIYKKYEEENMEKIEIKKNDEYIVDVIDNGFEGEGIAKINNFTIFIPGAIKG